MVEPISNRQSLLKITHSSSLLNDIYLVSDGSKQHQQSEVGKSASKMSAISTVATFRAKYLESCRVLLIIASSLRLDGFQPVHS